MAEIPDEMEATPQSLDGLGKTWERDDIIRHGALKRGSLLAWPDPKLTGVISFQTIAYNARLIEVLLSIHCPRTSSPKTVNIDKLRYEVGGPKLKLLV